MQSEEGAVKKVLKNEYAQVAAIIVVVWSFVTTVILPLQKLQFQVDQIQLAISNFTDANKQISAEHEDLKMRVMVLERGAKPSVKQ